MKHNGEPEHVGETRYQAGASATAVPVPGGLVWAVRSDTDGEIRHTARLAHIGHWSATSGRLPRVAAPKPLVAAAPATALFYPDVSNNNWNSVDDAIGFLEQLAPEGFSGVVHKVAEGNYYQDPFWQPVREWCEQNDLSWLGYQYITGDDPVAQAATWNANNGGPFAMFDFEANSGNIGNFWNVVNAFNAAGVDVSLGYIPQWYWNEIGSPDLSGLAPNGIGLVSSAYPGGGGYASTIYADGGGNGGEGFNPYGGATPGAWQFTDRANVDGRIVDCNAYIGANLNDLFTGATP